MGLAEAVSPLPDGGPSPADLARADGIDLHAQYSPERTGGDLFDTVRIGLRVAFLVIDIGGRRPELDPIAAEMQHVFRATSAELFSAANVNLMEAAETLILALNHALIAMAKGVRFAPTFIGCYDVQLGVLAYINAGGQTALFRDSEGTRALPNVSMPLGLFTAVAPCTQQAERHPKSQFGMLQGRHPQECSYHQLSKEHVGPARNLAAFQPASDLHQQP